MASDSNTGTLIATAALAVAGTMTLAWFIHKEKKRPFDENWCFTNRKIEKFNFKWTISNFSSYDKEVDEMLESRTFSADWPNDKEKWCLQIYPNGKDHLSKGYISMYLCLKETPQSQVRATFKLSIMKYSRMKGYVKEIQQCHKFVQGAWCGWHQFISRNYLLDKFNRLLRDDKLTVFCEVSVVTDTINEIWLSRKMQYHSYKNRPAEDFSHLLDNDIYNDCTLNLGGIEIKASKAILSRSPVFEAMFRHQTTESKSNVINITDVEHSVMKELVKYMYTGKAPNLQTMAYELLVAADRFGLMDLKMECEEALATNLTVENACETLIFADLTSAEQLKRCTIYFINYHLVRVMGTSGWKIMKKEHARLVVDMVEAFAGQ